jgi:hypothetical protein
MVKFIPKERFMQLWLLSLARSNFPPSTADGNSTRAIEDQRELQSKSCFPRRRAVVSRSPQSKVTAQQLRSLPFSIADDNILIATCDRRGLPCRHCVPHWCTVTPQSRQLVVARWNGCAFCFLLNSLLDCNECCKQAITMPSYKISLISTSPP